MYIIVNTEDDRICSEWNHMTETTKHICWKTPEEIEADNSYRVDNTRMKKFTTKNQAEAFIAECIDSEKLIAVSTNFIKRWWDDVVYEYRNKRNQDYVHSTY